MMWARKLSNKNQSSCTYSMYHKRQAPTTGSHLASSTPTVKLVCFSVINTTMFSGERGVIDTSALVLGCEKHRPVS